MEEITDKWLIRGLDGYFFGSDKNLYRKPYQSGLNHYGLRMLKKHIHNRYYIKGSLVSEKQLKNKLYLNPSPQVWISSKDLPF